MHFCFATPTLHTYSLLTSAGMSSGSVSAVLLLSTLATSAYFLPPHLVDRSCALHPVKLYLFRAYRLWWAVIGPTYLEQSAACTASTRTVGDRLHTCTEDTPLVVKTFLHDSIAEYKCTD